VTDSTTKIEYIIALEAAKEGIFVKKFVIKLGVVPRGLLLCRSIVRRSDNMFLAQGTKVSPNDQICTKLSHLRMSDP
jgi:hypothetical protein